MALLNGTQFMNAFGVHAVLAAGRPIQLGKYQISALSLDGFLMVAQSHLTAKNP